MSKSHSFKCPECGGSTAVGYGKRRMCKSCYIREKERIEGEISSLRDRLNTIQVEGQQKSYQNEIENALSKIGQLESELLFLGKEYD